MLKNYIKTAYKVFLRRKFFTFISLFAISFTLIVLMVATALFDHVFGPTSQQKAIYDEAIRPVVEEVLKGRRLPCRVRC